jgi:hypothetical protein
MIIQVDLDEENTVVQADLSNAFNCIHHRAFFEEVVTYLSGFSGICYVHFPATLFSGTEIIYAKLVYNKETRLVLSCSL